MINAKIEFLEALVENKVRIEMILCAQIVLGDGKFKREFNLPVDFTIEDYEKFEEELNFNYDNGHGSQNLFGFIWLHNRSWFERWEYDGAEGWDFKKFPEIPEELYRENSRIKT